MEGGRREEEGERNEKEREEERERREGGERREWTGVMKEEREERGKRGERNETEREGIGSVYAAGLPVGSMLGGPKHSLASSLSKLVRVAVVVVEVVVSEYTVARECSPVQNAIFG